jgi:hypothetical protein
MALVGAVNPDFGQVEVDPAVVNLTAFETFFEEKRPFFTEGSPVFLRFGRSGASEYTTFFYPEPQLFYSRRIGRAPQGSAAGAWVDSPDATTILGAAKLVGRKGGWNVGLLDAVTGRERARVATGASRDEVEVEPLTNYFVGRAQRAVGTRGSVGFVGTAVVRDLEEPRLDALLVGRALVGGVDGHVFLDGRRDWVVSGGLSGSHVSGSEASVLRVQRSAPRYYQRPDAPTWASTRRPPRCPAGAGGSGSTRTAATSPSTPACGGSAPATSRTTSASPPRPTAAARTARSSSASSPPTPSRGAGSSRSRSGGPSTTAARARATAWRSRSGASSGTTGTLDVALGKSWNTWDDKLTRGGPTTIRPGIESLTAVAASDSRRPFWVSARAALSNREFGGRGRQYSATLNLRPWTSLTIQATPTWARSRTIAQYLATRPDATAGETYGAGTCSGSSSSPSGRSPCASTSSSPRASRSSSTPRRSSRRRLPDDPRAARAADLRLPGLRTGRRHDRAGPGPALLRRRPRRGGPGRAPSASPSPTSTSSRSG